MSLGRILTNETNGCVPYYTQVAVPAPAEEEPEPAEGPSAIHRCFFPVGKGINWDHVISVYGTVALAWDESEFQKKTEDLKQLRLEAKSYGKEAIEAKILEAVRHLELDVGSMKELKKEFAADGSELMAAKIWTGCWCPFVHGWDTSLEDEFMSLKRLVYADDSKKKGCIARIFSEERKEIIKSINKATDRGHKGKIRMKRTKEEILATGRHRKRKHGTTQGVFFSLSINDSIGPDEVLRREGFTVSGRMVSPKVQKAVTREIKRKEEKIRQEGASAPGSPELKRVVAARRLCDEIVSEQKKVSHVLKKSL